MAGKERKTRAVTEELQSSVGRALAMDSGRLAMAGREQGASRYIEQLTQAGLSAADAANYGALYMARLQGGSAWTDADAARATAIENDPRNAAILTAGFGFFRGEHPARPSSGEQGK